MPTITVVDQVTRERHAPGVDHGGPIVVLARYGKRELWKTSGSRWRDESFPGQLEVTADADLYWRKGYEPGHKSIHEGVRGLKKVIAKCAEEIDKFFGCEVSRHLDPKKTVLVEGD